MVKNSSVKVKASNNGQKQKSKPGRASMRSAPVANSNSSKTINKSITQKGDTVVIHHRELLRPNYVAYDVFSVSDRFALNPGISTYSGGSPLGTWLPSIAANYDQYRFRKLCFHFQTYTSTLTPGMVIMSYDPNPENSNPVSLTDMQNAFFKNGSVHNNLAFDVSSKLPKDFKFTRTGIVPTLTTYDGGFVNLASIGSSGTSVGIVEIEYIVEFKQPQSAGATSAPLPSMPVLPVQYIIGTGASGVSDQLLNAAGAGGNPFCPGHLWGLGNSSQGAQLVTLSSPACTQAINGVWACATDIDTVVSNCTFKPFAFDANHAMGGLTRPLISFNRAGRYRVDVEAAFDINIQATAAYQLFGFRRTSIGGPRPSYTLPIVEFADINGNISIEKFPRVFVQQGVENSSAAGKTAADSTQVFSFEVAASDGDFYTLMGGGEASTLVAGNITITGRGGSVPAPRMIITYLGPRLTEKTLYDI